MAIKLTIAFCLSTQGSEGTGRGTELMFFTDDRFLSSSCREADQFDFSFSSQFSPLI